MTRTSIPINSKTFKNYFYINCYEFIFNDQKLKNMFFFHSAKYFLNLYARLKKNYRNYLMLYLVHNLGHDLLKLQPKLSQYSRYLVRHFCSPSCVLSCETNWRVIQISLTTPLSKLCTDTAVTVAASAVHFLK